MSVLTTAHRGASGSHPENTLSAFAEARRLGVERVEFDVRRTADGELVVLHDPTVDRTTNGSGPVWELTFCAVRSLDAGSHRGPRFQGERIPTFGEALSACPMLCNVHVYPGPSDLEAIVDEVVEELSARGRLDTALIAGEEPVVDRVAGLEPRLLRCLLGAAAAEADYPERSLDRGCANLQPWFTNVSPELVARAHDLGLAVHPFFADDAERMRLWIGYGVDGILTNEPALMQAIVAGRDA